MIVMEEFLTPEEIAKVLRKSEDTVTRWLRQGKIPGYKAEGTWVVNKKDFDTWLASRSNLIKPEDKQK